MNAVSERVPANQPAMPPAWKAMLPLRGIATCAVVLNHASQSASGIYLLGGATVAPALLPFGLATLALVRAFTPACLVLFVFASGFMAHRMYQGPRSSLPAALLLLRKYLFWSLAFYLFYAALTQHFEPLSLVRHLVLGDVMPAYWFPLMLVALQLGTPLFVGLVQRWPIAALALALLLQAATCAKLYFFDLDAVDPGFWERVLVRPLSFVPAFLVGMLASRSGSDLVSTLVRHRTALALATGLAALASLAESSWLAQEAGYRFTHLSTAFATERPTLILFAFLSIGLMITIRFSPRAARWFTDVGNGSLGIMFLMDFSIRVATWFVFHLPRAVHMAGPFTYSGLPRSVVVHGPWLLPLFFAAGLFGPLVAQKWARGALGPRVHHIF